MTRLTLAALPVVAALLAPTAIPAQERRLTTPADEYPEPFDAISGFRALDDQRVLVSDGIGEVLVSVDLGNLSADTLGRKGKGPGEYTMPDQLFPLPGGESLLLDLGNGRMTVVGADGTFGASHSIAQDDGANFAIVMPRATDGAGNIYYQPMGGGPNGGRRDSAAVLRRPLSGGPSDTVAMIKLQEVKIESSGPASSRNISMRPVPYSAQDAWDVAADGRVAMARAGSEYRLDWAGTNGAEVRGQPVDYRPVKIGAAEKEEFIDARSAGLGVMVAMDNGRRSVSFGRGGSMGPRPSVGDYQWPDSKPPFPAGSVSVAPDGNAWVRRSTKAGEPQRFDVFDGEGNRTGEVVLPADRRLLGFGPASVYLAYVDEDDLQWLERYEMP
jgi:hypothetical protein